MFNFVYVDLSVVFIRIALVYLFIWIENGIVLIGSVSHLFKIYIHITSILILVIMIIGYIFMSVFRGEKLQM